MRSESSEMFEKVLNRDDLRPLDRELYSEVHSLVEDEQAPFERLDYSWSKVNEASFDLIEKDLLQSPLLHNCHLKDLGLKGTQLRHLDFRESLFEACHFHNVDFDLCVLESVQFKNCRFDNCRFELRERDLIKFNECTFYHVSLKGDPEPLKAGRYRDIRNMARQLRGDRLRNDGYGETIPIYTGIELQGCKGLRFEISTKFLLGGLKVYSSALDDLVLDEVGIGLLDIVDTQFQDSKIVDSFIDTLEISKDTLQGVSITETTMDRSGWDIQVRHVVEQNGATIIRSESDAL